MNIVTDPFLERCIAAHREDVRATALRWAAHAEHLTKEAIWWLHEVRRRYQERHEYLMVVAGTFADRGDEKRYQRLAVRVRRWERIIQRFDGLTGEVQFCRFWRASKRNSAAARAMNALDGRARQPWTQPANCDYRAEVRPW
jgi:hypothetical protein